MLTWADDGALLERSPTRAFWLVGEAQAEPGVDLGLCRRGRRCGQQP